MKVSVWLAGLLLGIAPTSVVAQEGPTGAPPMPPGTILDSPLAGESPEAKPPAPRESAGLTLAELEDLAQRHNPTLVQAAARIQAAQGLWQQAGLHPNPVIGYRANEMGNNGRAGQQGGFIGQEVVTAGKLPLSQAVAAQEIQQARSAWEAQRLRVLTDVRRGFYSVLAAQHALEIAEQLVRIGDEGVKTAERLFAAKEVARFDVLQARIEADSARVAAEKARNRHAAAWRQLVAAVGAPDVQPARLAGSLQEGLAPLTWDETLGRILAESPVLAGARSGVARAQASLQRECAARVPNVDVQAGVLFDNATENTIGEFQLGVPLPVFNRNQGNIRRAQAELTAARAEVDRVALDLRRRLAAAFEQYQTARYQAEKYQRDILPNAKASLDLVAGGYRQGEFNYLTLLTAQRTYFQASLEYVQALQDLRAAAAAIEGKLLSDSLEASR